MAEYTIENYQLNVSDGSFSRIASYITVQDLEFYSRLNGAGQMTFAFDIHDPNLDPNHFKLYRNNFLVKRNGVVIWLGTLTGVDANMESNDGEVTIEVTEYFYHLSGRRTEQSYLQTSVAAGDVAWDLIDTVQSRTNGNLGIVRGGIEAITAINETLEYARIDEAIMNLSDNISGFDFYLQPVLDANKLLSEVRFNVLKSRSRTIVNKKITYDQVHSIITSTNRKLFNTTTALAYGTGDNILIATATDAPSQSAYTRRERLVKLSGYRIEDNLSAAATAINEQTKVQRNMLNITLRPGGLFDLSNIELGDIITIDLNNSKFPPILRLTGTARVEELNVRVDQEGVEFITPKFKFI